MVRFWLTVSMTIVALATACASEPWQGGLEGAPAAYIHLADSGSEASDLVVQLTSVSGTNGDSFKLLDGLLGFARRTDARTGVVGYRLEFADDAPDSTREIVRDRALAEGLDEPIWLGLDDEWPDCASEPDCQLVREARGE